MRDEATPAVCPAMNQDGYQCELAPHHEGEHRAVIGAIDEQGPIPEVRWHETPVHHEFSANPCDCPSCEMPSARPATPVPPSSGGEPPGIAWLRTYIAPDAWAPVKANEDYAIFGGMKLSDLRRVLADYDALRERVEAAERERDEALERAGLADALVEALADPDPCVYDHHGYCQTHSLDPRPCPHEQAREHFRATPTETSDAE